MTSWQVPGADDFHQGPLGPCPCGHGDVGAEIERQRPLISRAIQGDPGALGVLYDDHVDDVYRYLMAWTWDPAAARELTDQVFRGAVTWLPAIAEGKGDLGAWLIALARDAVGQRRGLGWAAQQVQAQVPPRDPFDAVDQLDDAQREVVVLRLLLGHSMGHTAHLAGYDGRVVQELEFAACLAIWQLLSGIPVDPPPVGLQDMRPPWFEHFLSGAATDPATDSSLTDALSVANALRQGAADHVPLPDDGFVTHLRDELLRSIGGDLEEAPPPPVGRLGRAFALVRLHVARHPWAATTVAASAIGLVLGLQLAGSPARPTCTDGSCAATTTAAEAAPQDQSTLPTLPAVGGGSTTTSRIASGTQTSHRPTTTRSPPPTTAPPTTVPRTTRTTQAPTTTKRRGPPTTHPPPTTSATTTTQSPPTTGGGGNGQVLGG